MERGIQGRKEQITTASETVAAFVPVPLPPEPPLDLEGIHGEKLGRANRAIGRLDGVISILPTTHFLYQYVRKEALLSSQIEGTQSSLSDLLLFENEEQPGVPIDDVEEVVQYIAALNHGLQRIDEGFPISSRLLREIHGVLLSSGRGSERNPGEFRRSQNWIGGTRPGNATYVPPPHHLVPELMGQLEHFLHGTHGGERYPLLLRAAMAHVQFETIHPFLDGNGRVGRLLVTLLLCDGDALSRPTLYLSLYLKAHRARYYELLQKVRFEGDWESWIDFFLDGVVASAEQAAETARRLLELFQTDRTRIDAEAGRAAGSALRVHEFLEYRLLSSVPEAARHLPITRPTIQTMMERLMEMGIVSEIPDRKKRRVYVYTEALAILAEGTEPLAR